MQALPLYPMWVGGYYHYVFIYSQLIFLTKEVDKRDARRISAHYGLHNWGAVRLKKKKKKPGGLVIFNSTRTGK